MAHRLRFLSTSSSARASASPRGDAGRWCRRFGCLAVWGSVLVAPPAAAQALADPTRPAAPPAPASAVARRGDAVAGPTAWPQLQSVQVAPQGGSSALVDGRVVRVGDSLGELRVVAIDAQGITLRGARFEQRLALVPGIVKTASLVSPSAPRQVVAVVTKEFP